MAVAVGVDPLELFLYLIEIEMRMERRQTF